jgi:hypothetical protein
MEPKEMVMTKKNGMVLGFLLASSLAACSHSPAEADTEANEAQRRAGEAAAEARREAGDKVAKAQAKADAEARRAEEILVQARDEVRTGVQRDLDAVAIKVDDLAARVAKTTGRHRSELDAALKDIDGRRAALRQDLARLDAATAQELEAMKASLAGELADLKKAVEDTRSRL